MGIHKNFSLALSLKSGVRIIHQGGLYVGDYGIYSYKAEVTIHIVLFSKWMPKMLFLSCIMVMNMHSHQIAP